MEKPAYDPNVTPIKYHALYLPHPANGNVQETLVARINYAIMMGTQNLVVATYRNMDEFTVEPPLENLHFPAPDITGLLEKLTGKPEDLLHGLVGEPEMRGDTTKVYPLVELPEATRRAIQNAVERIPAPTSPFDREKTSRILAENVAEILGIVPSVIEPKE